MPSVRVSYHTSIKYLAREGLLSAPILKRIPRSNIHRWKSEDPQKYQTFDLHLQGTSEYDLVRQFARHKKAKRVFSAYVRLIKTIISLAHALPGFHRAIKEQKQTRC